MKIILFARTLGSMQICKISQEFGLLSNFVNLPKIENTCFGYYDPLRIKVKLPKTITNSIVEEFVLRKIQQGIL